MGNREALILRLLIGMADILTEGIKMMDAPDDATADERSDAVAKLLRTKADVQRRLDDMKPS